MTKLITDIQKTYHTLEQSVHRIRIGTGRTHLNTYKPHMEITTYVHMALQLAYVNDKIHQFVFVHLLSLKVGHEEADVIALNEGRENEGKFLCMCMCVPIDACVC